jgi:RNA polymerase sigma factor (sigma-70 family)
MGEPPDDVLPAAAGEDADAFGTFYRRHAGALLAYLAYRTRDAEEAVDLLAETFAAAFAARRRYRPGVVPARGWLFGIANHKLADSRRRRSRERRAQRRLGVERIVLQDEQLEAVEQLVDAQRDGPRLAMFLDGLPARQREAVLTRVVDERGYAELAARTGTSEVGARKLVSRAWPGWPPGRGRRVDGGRAGPGRAPARARRSAPRGDPMRAPAQARPRGGHRGHAARGAVGSLGDHRPGTDRRRARRGARRPDAAKHPGGARWPPGGGPGRGDDGHVYTFAGFHARRAFRPRSGRSVCSTQTRDDHRRIPGLGCAGPTGLAKILRRYGLLGGPLWGSSQLGGLRVTTTASGFVPGDARRVTLRIQGEPAVEANLSEPMPTSLGRRTAPGQIRAFLAVATHDSDGPHWVGGPRRRTITVVLGDGTVKRQGFPEPQFFPMVETTRPQRSPVHMGHAGYPTAWRSVSYRGERRTLCTAAAPVGERLITLSKLQCSSPLAIVNVLSRFGAAVYHSNFNPRRERGAAASPCSASRARTPER